MHSSPCGPAPLSVTDILHRKLFTQKTLHFWLRVMVVVVVMMMMMKVVKAEKVMMIMMKLKMVGGKGDFDDDYDVLLRTLQTEKTLHF